MPLVASAPLQPPEAVQLETLVLVQFNVELCPLTTVLGAAVSVIASWESPTETSTTWEASPPGPVQVSVKSVESFRLPVPTDPVVDIGPRQPPLASQASALSACQSSVALCPIRTELGVADSVIEGACLAAPEQPATASISVSAQNAPDIDRCN